MLGEIHIYTAIGITLLYLFLGKSNLVVSSGEGLASFFSWITNKVIIAPIIGLLVLWVSPVFMGLLGIEASYYLTFSDIYNVVGNDIDLVVLILSLAYLSISLDEAGFFEYSSLKIVKASKGSGERLLINLFLLASILTYFTSNDIVIIAMTPTIIYVSRHTGGHNAIPLLISLFVAANTLSMGLYIGSPTNIVIGDAVGLSFIAYMKLMLVPSIVSLFVTLGLLYLVFVKFPIGGNRIFNSYSVPVLSKHDKATKIMRLKVLIFTIFIFLLSVLSIEIWQLCLFFAAVMCFVDIIYLLNKRKSKRVFFSKVGKKIPWEIAPFVVSFFILVNAMEETVLSKGVLTLLQSLFDYSFEIGVLGSGFLAAISVNVMNDIPSTMFWANLLTNIEPLLSQQEFNALTAAILVGVNPGCYLTIIGALAGLMWIKIIHKSNENGELIVPSAWDLTKYGAIILVPVLLVTLFSVVWQFKYI